MAVFALIIHLVFGGGLIYAAEIDNLNTTISSNFSKAYSNYGDSLITTIGIDIVQVCLKNIYLPCPLFQVLLSLLSWALCPNMKSLSYATL